MSNIVKELQHNQVVVRLPNLPLASDVRECTSLAIYFDFTPIPDADVVSHCLQSLLTHLPTSCEIMVTMPSAETLHSTSMPCLSSLVSFLRTRNDQSRLVWDVTVQLEAHVAGMLDIFTDLRIGRVTFRSLSRPVSLKPALGERLASLNNIRHIILTDTVSHIVPSSSGGASNVKASLERLSLERSSCRLKDLGLVASAAGSLRHLCIAGLDVTSGEASAFKLRLPLLISLEIRCHTQMTFHQLACLLMAWDMPRLTRLAAGIWMSLADYDMRWESLDIGLPTIHTLDFTIFYDIHKMQGRLEFLNSFLNALQTALTGNTYSRGLNVELQLLDTGPVDPQKNFASMLSIAPVLRRLSLLCDYSIFRDWNRSNARSRCFGRLQHLEMSCAPSTDDLRVVQTILNAAVLPALSTLHIIGNSWEFTKKKPCIVAKDLLSFLIAEMGKFKSLTRIGLSGFANAKFKRDLLEFITTCRDKGIDLHVYNHQIPPPPSAVVNAE